MDFEALANQHKDAVYRQLIRVCGNREDAEDVLVEALLRAYRNLEQLRETSAFRSWLAQIGRRVCWQLKRREALLPIIQLSAIEAAGPQLQSADEGPDTRASMQQMKRLLLGAIESLPERERVVYELRDLEELSGEEAAARLGISLPAVKSRLHRARVRIRSYIDAALARDARAASW
ncbi:MAG TPA: RNA polymerase sigma factor [Candidatus Binatia bacterium]|nr:RNA polymerase sigma factor [Candidatus Binatia bacterium]